MTDTPRQLPHNVEAEESLLGAMLLSTNAVEDVAPHLTAETFYESRRGHIFAAIVALHDAHMRADPVTVAAKLAETGLLELCGGSAALVNLQAGTPTVSNAAHYALLVRDDYYRRIGLCGLAEGSARLFEGGSAHEVIGELADRFSEAAPTTSTWDPVDLADLWRGDPETPFTPPLLGVRIDGARFVAPGAKGLFLAPPESSKSMLALALCVEAAKQGRASIYVDFESRERRVQGRLAQHLDGRLCENLWHYIRPQRAITPSDRWRARRLIDRTGAVLVVIDGYNALLAKHKLDANKTTDIAELAETVMAPWSGEDVCTVIIDHVAKDDTRMGRPATAIGSIAKTGLVDYAIALEPDPDNRIARGRTGWATLTVAKDRDGEIRHLCPDQRTYGRFTVRSTPAGRWEHHILMPDGMRSDTPPTWRT